MTIAEFPTAVTAMGAAAPDAIRESVTSALTAEFVDRLDRHTVDLVVQRAVADLAGEVPIDSLGEFVHRSARQRLLETATGDPNGGVRRWWPAAG